MARRAQRGAHGLSGIHGKSDRSHSRQGPSDDPLLRSMLQRPQGPASAEAGERYAGPEPMLFICQSMWPRLVVNSKCRGSTFYGWKKAYDKEGKAGLARKKPVA